jgi:hypothetical protein
VNITITGCAPGLGGTGDVDADLLGRDIGEVELKWMGAAEALAQEETAADRRGARELKSARGVSSYVDSSGLLLIGVRRRRLRF